MKSDRGVCIHGHFYQPPRESPWRESIEVQDSAHPFHDWNERIAEECYGPCARARLLDSDGRVRRTMNVYASISFNVGPTLASWLEENDRATHEAILAADRESQARCSGHGNAIAQAYGHAILPLASRRDKETQVRWGIRDFELRFHRRPEALWLPEMAVDVETLEVLAAEAMRYVLLAPHQISRVRAIGSTSWQPVNAATLDTAVPYLVPLPSGRSIVAFAYDGAIAHDVAFGGLLQSGDRLADRLLHALRGSGLLHFATDGETYGHHHRFGEMALAFALERLGTRDDVRVTNYAEWLDDHPPRHEAEVAASTSWSCSHGIERWRADCGCTTDPRPGWNQAWRAPLRRAVDELGARVDDLYESRARGLLRDPWVARDAYVDVVLDPAAADAFLGGQASRPLAADGQVEALRLLEMERHRLLAATSCGWYFADLAGLETVQVLRYAARAVELAEALGARGVEEAFVEELAGARSNDPTHGDGASIYDRLARAAIIDPARAVQRRALALLCAGSELEDSPGIAVEVEEETERSASDGRLLTGRARTTVRRTQETTQFVYVAARSDVGPPAVGVGAAESRAAVADVELRFAREGANAAARRITELFSPPVDVPQLLSARDLVDLEADLAASAFASIEAGDGRFALLDDSRIARDPSLRGLAAFALERRLCALANSLDSLDAFGSLLERAKTMRLAVDEGRVAHDLARAIARTIAGWEPRGVSVPSADLTARAAARARGLAADVNLWRAQEAYLAIVDRLRCEGPPLDEPARDAFDRLGDALGVRVDLTPAA